MKASSDAGPPQGASAPSGGSAVRAATSVGVTRILVIKLSSLGDVVHTMPAVQDMRRALPDAQIDWVVEEAFAPLVARCEGVHRVIPCALRRWRKSFWTTGTRIEWQAFRQNLRLEAYVAVIDLHGLTKSAVVARLARLAAGGKRYAMANATDGSSYEAPTRWLADVALPMERHVHAVQRSRQLCAGVFGYAEGFLEEYGLVAGVNRSLFAINNVANKNIVLVMSSSRADKLWPTGHWQALAVRLIEAGYALQLVHGNDAEEAACHALAQAVRCAVLPRLGLDALTDALAACDGCIGVDSGVSHIAVALGLRHVQIYNFDTAWRTGPQGAGLDGRPRQVSVFARPAPTVDAVWQAWLTVQRETLP